MDLNTAAIVAAVLVIIVIIWEIAVPTEYKDGFADYISPVGGKSSWWGKFIPARGDVGEYLEENGYIADPRYFHGYSEVQRLGLGRDYCRMVRPIGGGENSAFFACGLAGTEGMSSVAYRTKSIEEGLRTSRDDYMRDVADEGRAAYCAIVKRGGEFQARCYRAYDSKFSGESVIDPSPPDETAELLGFYDGIMMWYRLRDDMNDYALNTFASVAGGLQIEEMPSTVTRGLTLNGVDQYLRLGGAGSGDLALTEAVPMRVAKAFSVWVRFDEFTENARVFDFGNGSGRDNVCLGVVGSGNIGVSVEEEGAVCSDQATNTVPAGPSGAQEVDEVRPQTLMLTTGANIDRYKCMKPEVMGATLGKAGNEVGGDGDGGGAKTAHLIYEVWDGTQRCMRVIVPNAIKRKVWTHIVITSTTSDSYRPDVTVYIDGMKRHVERNGFLPQTNFMSHAYIGRSNWEDDGLLKGAVFDFRVYNKEMSEKKIKATVAWGKRWLGM